ncbi:unnamed protein product, partial [Laminaria digitata]
GGGAAEAGGVSKSTALAVGASPAAVKAAADAAAKERNNSRLRAFANRRASSRRQSGREATATSATAAAAAAVVAGDNEEPVASGMVSYDGIVELGKAGGARRRGDADPYAHPPGLLTDAVRTAMGGRMEAG